MKRAFPHTFTSFLLAIVAVVGGSASAQTTANGPYYATPSWDQTFPTATRYIVLSNMKSEAVLDRETGLVWERAPDNTLPDGFRTWEASRRYCARKTVGGRMGWRLPAFNELASLYNVAGSGFLGGVPGAPFVTPNIYAYWTSTGYIDNTQTPGLVPQAYIVSFTIGGIDGALPQNAASTFGAWCVRGGNSGDVE